MFVEQNTTFITTVESIKITVEQYVIVQSHFCSCIITKVAAWLCFCVTVPTGIDCAYGYLCVLSHTQRTGPWWAHQPFTVDSPCGWEAFILLLIIFWYCYMFYNEYALLLQLKNHKQEKNNSCHLQNIQSTSQALCWPPDRCHLILCSPWLQVWNSDILYSR